MSSSLYQPSISADDTMPETAFGSISEMIADTLATLSDDESAWPNVLAPERVTREPTSMGFTKTF